MCYINFYMEYWNFGIMEYWVQKEFRSNFDINEIHPLNPSFHRSIFPLFHF